MVMTAKEVKLMKATGADLKMLLNIVNKDYEQWNLKRVLTRKAVDYTSKNEKKQTNVCKQFIQEMYKD